MLGEKTKQQDTQKTKIILVLFTCKLVSNTAEKKSTSIQLLPLTHIHAILNIKRTFKNMNKKKTRDKDHIRQQHQIPQQHRRTQNNNNVHTKTATQKPIKNKHHRKQLQILHEQ